MGLDDITREVIGSAMEVHSGLGAGFLEAVYQNSLAYEMETRGLDFSQQTKLDIRYKEQLVGVYIPDFFVEEQLIVEIKSVESLVSPHHVQTVNYLAATGIDVGLLINFGAPSLEFHRKHRIKKSKKNPVNPDNKSC